MNQKVWISGTKGTFTAHSSNCFEGSGLSLLALFLTDMGNLETNIEDFNNPNLGYVIGNETTAVKNDNEIIIEYQYSDDDESWTYTLGKEQFFKILELWQKIFKVKPLRIDITQEDNKFIFEFDSPEGQQKIVVQ